MGPATLQSSPTLIASADADLRTQLIRLCAAASVSPELIESPELLRPVWRAAPCVIIGDDIADAAARLSLPRRGGVVLVSSGDDSAELWKRGVALGADDVVVLPTDQARLVQRLSDAAEGAGRAFTVAVVGSRGGAGSSTLACALALRAARKGHGACLVDADPMSGGVELVLGSEDRDGLRWPDVAATHGRIAAAALRAALPQHDGVAVLSWDRGAATSVTGATMRTMIAAASRAFTLVVIDLPRHRDEAAAEALAMSDTLLLVVTADVGGVAGAGQMLASLRILCPDIRAVVRHASQTGLSPETVAETLVLPLAGVIPTRRAVDRSINEGLGPLARGRLAGRCDELLAGLARQNAGS